MEAAAYLCIDCGGRGVWIALVLASKHGVCVLRVSWVRRCKSEIHFFGVGVYDGRVPMCCLLVAVMAKNRWPVPSRKRSRSPKCASGGIVAAGMQALAKAKKDDNRRLAQGSDAVKVDKAFEDAVAWVSSFRAVIYNAVDPLTARASAQQFIERTEMFRPVGEDAIPRLYDRDPEQYYAIRDLRREPSVYCDFDDLQSGESPDWVRPHYLLPPQ